VKALILLSSLWKVRVQL